MTGAEVVRGRTLATVHAVEVLQLGAAANVERDEVDAKMDAQYVTKRGIVTGRLSLNTDHLQFTPRFNDANKKLG